MTIRRVGESVSNVDLAASAPPITAPETGKKIGPDNLSVNNPSLLDRLHEQFERAQKDFHTQTIKDRLRLDTTVITRDPNYTRLTSSQRAIIRGALSKFPDNAELIEQFRALIRDGRFHELKSDDRGYALNGMAKNPGAQADDLLRFTATASYRGFSRAQKQQGQQIIGLLSADSTLNPSHNPIARNTLEHLVTGSVELGLPTRAQLKRDGFTEEDLNTLYGFADENRMNFNIYRPGILNDREAIVTTAAHEINHVINDRGNYTEPVSPERALDEYRAWYVETSAYGVSPPPLEYMKGVWENLFGEKAGYENLRELYVRDPHFKEVADQVKADLERGLLTDPEAFRLALAKLIGKDPFIQNSNYLIMPGNLDNRF